MVTSRHRGRDFLNYIIPKRALASEGAILLHEWVDQVFCDVSPHKRRGKKEVVLALV